MKQNYFYYYRCVCMCVCVYLYAYVCIYWYACFFFYIYLLFYLFFIFIPIQTVFVSADVDKLLWNWSNLRCKWCCTRTKYYRSVIYDIYVEVHIDGCWSMIYICLYMCAETINDELIVQRICTHLFTCVKRGRNGYVGWNRKWRFDCRDRMAPGSRSW